MTNQNTRVFGAFLHFFLFLGTGKIAVKKSAYDNKTRPMQHFLKEFLAKGFHTV